MGCWLHDGNRAKSIDRANKYITSLFFERSDEFLLAVRHISHMPPSRILKSSIHATFVHTVWNMTISPLLWPAKTHTRFGVADNNRPSLSPSRPDDVVDSECGDSQGANGSAPARVSRGGEPNRPKSESGDNAVEGGNGTKDQIRQPLL